MCLSKKRMIFRAIAKVSELGGGGELEPKNVSLDGVQDVN